MHAFFSSILKKSETKNRTYIHASEDTKQPVMTVIAVMQKKSNIGVTEVKNFR